MEFPLRSKKEKRNNAIIWATIPTFFVLTFIAILIFETNETTEDKFKLIKLGILTGFVLICYPFVYRSSRNSEGYRNANVVISDKGLEFSTAKSHQFMAWNEISYVIIIRVGLRYQIRFFTYKFSQDDLGMGYTLYPSHSLGDVTDKYGSMTFSKEALVVIKKYFKMPITNEYILYLKEGSVW